MIEYHLDIGDLASTRFATSPLFETATSLWAWRDGAERKPHLASLCRRRPALAGLDTELLDALVSDRGWMPDFLTPQPTGPRAELPAELALLRATDADRVVADLDAVARAVPLHPVLARGRRDPERLLARIADALEAYWQRLIAPEWPRMRAILEADIVHRSLQLARGGAAALFADLDRRVRWQDGVLSVEGDVHEVVRVAGRGLPLVPSIFAPHAVTLVRQDQPLIVAYPARGRAALWLHDLPVPPSAVAALLGHTRATLLALLEERATTTELAARLDVTPSAVNQHLRALAAAGLLGRVRVGREVLYARTPVADAWLGGLAGVAG